MIDVVSKLEFVEVRLRGRAGPVGDPWMWVRILEHVREAREEIIRLRTEVEELRHEAWMEEQDR